MAFQMNFDTDNAAFADDPAAEVARILRGILDKVESWDGDPKFQTIFDINGNDVGRWKLEADLAGAGDEEDDTDELGDEWDNVDQREYQEDEETTILRMASADNPGLAFTADGSDAPERPQF